jgi:hypothetical protein
MAAAVVAILETVGLLYQRVKLYISINNPESVLKSGMAATGAVYFMWRSVIVHKYNPLVLLRGPELKSARTRQYVLLIKVKTGDLARPTNVRCQHKTFAINSGSLTIQVSE